MFASMSILSIIYWSRLHSGSTVHSCIVDFGLIFKGLNSSCLLITSDILANDGARGYKGLSFIIRLGLTAMEYAARFDFPSSIKCKVIP